VVQLFKIQTPCEKENELFVNHVTVTANAAVDCLATRFLPEIIKHLIVE
jgi:hypothetical protein